MSSSSPQPSIVAAPAAAGAELFSNLDPVKAEKLNERFSRAPGASSTVGFEENTSSSSARTTSMPAISREENNNNVSPVSSSRQEEEPEPKRLQVESDVEDEYNSIGDELKLASSGKKKRVLNRFSAEEDEMLLAKQQELGSNWKAIVQASTGDLAARTPSSISKRFTALQAKRVAVEEEDDDEVQIVSVASVKPPAAAVPPSPPTTNKSTSLDQFGFTSSRPTQQTREELDRMRLELEKSTRETHIMEEELAQRTKDLDMVTRESKLRKEKSCEVFQSILRSQDEQEALKARRAALENSLVYGRYIVVRSGNAINAQPKEIFEDGPAKKELDAKRTQLLAVKVELDKKRAPKRNAAATASNNNYNNASSTLEALMEDRAAEEMRQMKQTKYKRDSEEFAARLDAYRAEKMLHQRELRRIQHEDASKFSTRPVLKGRYLLRQLLGKGGFSEVWKAFDFELMRDVAVKIHELDPSWSEERKANYLKHAKREYEIHAAIRHPRIAQLFGLIDQIDGSNNSFATVMEYCSGHDLDFMLKRNQTLSEKEAKCVLVQMLSGLLHLSNGAGIKNSLGIIHFDIKPANILFDSEGSVKITDFGLSKIVTDENMETYDGGIELTSQGAGTYWYLPPECFNFDRKNPPSISSKVDVFSAGVVFYQMLYGVRPFGEGKTQESMLKDGTMTGALRVNFPENPPVSDAAKEFIRRCLTHSQDLRPDMVKLCNDPYITSKSISKAKPTPSPASAAAAADNHPVQ